MLDINQLIFFYEVAKAGSYQAAANKTDVSPSWVSRQITDIENKLNFKVFTRNYGSIQLTSEGEKLLDSVRKIIYEARIIETLIPDASDENNNKLIITTTTGHASVWLVKYMKGFLAKYPNIKISIIGTDETLDLQAREADVAIRPFVENSDLEHVYLLSYPLALYASKEYLADHGIPKNVEELDNHQLIAFSQNNKIPFGDVDWHLRLGCKPGQERKPYIEVNSSMGLAKLAQDGLGIVSLSKNHEVLKSAGLVEVLPKIKGPKIDIYYVYPKKLENKKHITVLGDYLVEALKREEMEKSAKR